MESRKTILEIIKQKTGLDEIWSKDLEIGIYNWCLTFAESRNIIKRWSDHKFTNLYLEKSRSILSNLDRKGYIGNSNLLDRLLKGEFLPHELANLKPENIFPERWKNERELHDKKFQHAFENKDVAMTEMYLCRKCKKRECSYYGVQTRGADEPETIFVRCIPCGAQWRV